MSKDKYQILSDEIYQEIGDISNVESLIQKMGKLLLLLMGR